MVLFGLLNVLIAGKSVVVSGYGHVGKGIASRARGLGASVIVTEIDPINALKAKMDGFIVSPMEEASSIGDLFITATGCKDVIIGSHIERMKNGVILANAGHFNVEISIEEIKGLAKSSKHINENVEQFILKNDSKINVIGEGKIGKPGSCRGSPIRSYGYEFC